jgi:hypothetical protein
VRVTYGGAYHPTPHLDLISNFCLFCDIPTRFFVFFREMSIYYYLKGEKKKNLSATIRSNCSLAYPLELGASNWVRDGNLSHTLA